MLNKDGLIGEALAILHDTRRIHTAQMRWLRINKKNGNPMSEDARQLLRARRELVARIVLDVRVFRNTLTLAQFRRSRRIVADARYYPAPHVADCYGDNPSACPVYVYAADLVIDTNPDASRFFCTISSDSREGALADLEQWLYEYGKSEEMF